MQRGRGGGGRGRGAYYKAKYGNKRGRDVGHDEEQHSKREGGTEGPEGREDLPNAGQTKRGGTANDLKNILLRIDGLSYGAYKDIHGTYSFDEFTLTVDHVQSDPFAPPSIVIAKIPLRVAGFPPDYHSSPIRTTALCDFLNREFFNNVHQMPELLPTGGGYQGYKGGELGVAKPSQHVLQRSSVSIPSTDSLEIRFTASMPAKGRSIVGGAAIEMLMERIPKAIRLSFIHKALNDEHLKHHIYSVEDQEYLRNSLSSRGLIAFVRNGAVMPRQSGSSDLPLPRSSAIPFSSPRDMEVTIEVPNGDGKGEGRKSVTGMAIPKGITLIVGGGFHGKSTLLTALEVGVYNHIPGDGREFVVSDPSAVKIRAEDGRSVEGVNISPFINNLPFGKPTNNFSTECASGSTSQSANIMEALEVGSNLLLIDEDTSATNFMIRDRRMQMLISKDKEPITPLVYKIKQMYKDVGASVVLVMGGSGDYFEVADHVIMMDCYLPRNITKEAREVCAKFPIDLANEGGTNFGTITHRCPVDNLASDGKIKCTGIKSILYGSRQIDLSAVEQLVEMDQTRVIGDCLNVIAAQMMDGKRTVGEVVDELDARFNHPNGLQSIAPFTPAFYTRPRKFEIAAAINRLRDLKMKQKTKK